MLADPSSPATPPKPTPPPTPTPPPPPPPPSPPPPSGHYLRVAALGAFDVVCDLEQITEVALRNARDYGNSYVHRYGSEQTAYVALPSGHVRSADSNRHVIVIL